MPNSKNIKTGIMETTAPIRTQFCTPIKTTSADGVQTRVSKMVNGRHLEKNNKSLYLSNGLTDRHDIW